MLVEPLPKGHQVSIHNLLDQMESAEDAFLKTEFLAPVLPGGQVRSADRWHRLLASGSRSRRSRLGHSKAVWHWIARGS